MISLSEHNRKVAISRWKKVFEKQTAKIIETSKKYPYLKARVIGYLMGDGSVTLRHQKEGSNHHTICFYPDDEQMLKSFLYAFKKIYSLVPKIQKVPGHFRVRVGSKAAMIDLLKLGSFRSMEWRIPTQLLTSQDVKREWLRAFYDSEAYVGPQTITVQSVNENGLRQVQELLREFEIESRLYSYERKEKRWNTNYLLHIAKKADRIRFLKHIGFNHSAKHRKLEAFASVA